MRERIATRAGNTPALCSWEFAASVLILIGFFGPWVAHRSAALTVTGYEMSEFAKFFPQVQGGVVSVRRGLFITPFLAALITLALIVHRSSTRSLLRLVGTALAVLLALAVLPPHQAILEPAYRSQLILVAVGMLLAAATAFTGQFSQRARAVLFLLVAVVGLVPSLWQYVLLRPLIAELYAAPVLLGWGLAVCVTGFLLLALSALRDILAS